MNRRDFLKLTALTSTSMVLNFAIINKLSNSSVQFQVGDQVYKGTSGGDILISRDSGETWQLHTRLSPGSSISKLGVDMADRMFANVRYSGYSFQLVLSDDGRNWQTL